MSEEPMKIDFQCRRCMRSTTITVFDEAELEHLSKACSTCGAVTKFTKPLKKTNHLTDEEDELF